MGIAWQLTIIDHFNRCSGDSRSVGLFHYLLSGDDLLMRQAITNFAASVTLEGLTQSHFSSHVPQLIAGFSLYWILQVCDHHFFPGSTADTADDLAYSQRCQLFAVLCGAAQHADCARLLTESFANPHFSKCSYVMRFYALRASPSQVTTSIRLSGQMCGIRGGNC
jgi:hypothetical protein